MLPLSSLREGGSHGPGNGAHGGIPAGVRALSPGGSWLLGCLLPGLRGFGGKEPICSCVDSAGVWRNGVRIRAHREAVYVVVMALCLMSLGLDDAHQLCNLCMYACLVTQLCLILCEPMDSK